MRHPPFSFGGIPCLQNELVAELLHPVLCKERTLPWTLAIWQAGICLNHFNGIRTQQSNCRNSLLLLRGYGIKPVHSLNFV